MSQFFYIEQYLRHTQQLRQCVCVWENACTFYKQRIFHSLFIYIIRIIRHGDSTCRIAHFFHSDKCFFVNIWKSFSFYITSRSAQHYRRRMNSNICNDRSIKLIHMKFILYIEIHTRRKKYGFLVQPIYLSMSR